MRLNHEQALSLHRDLLIGRRRAVIWGMSGHLPYHIAQAPYPIHAIIDSNATSRTGGENARDAEGTRMGGIPVIPPAGLAAFDPAHTVVILSADPDRYGAAIAAQVAALGAYPMVAPLTRPQTMLLEQQGHLCRWRDWPADLAGPDALGSGRYTDPVADFATNLFRLAGERAGSIDRGETVPSRSIVLLIGSIAPGGTERQICHLAAGLRQRGWRVTVLTLFPSHPGAAHYLDILEDAGVALRSLAGPRDIWGAVPSDEALRRNAGVFTLGRGLDLYLLHALTALTAALQADSPTALISYLDVTNMIAGIAGILTGVPRILLSGRSVHPDNFPALDAFCVRPALTPDLFRALASHPSVRLANNSRAGALSYAQWMGVAPDAIRVVPNAVDVRAPVAGTLERLRAALGIAPGQRVLIGVMRLSEEKQPLLFIDVAARLSRAFSDLVVLLAGDGPLLAAVREKVRACGLDKVVRILGVRGDVHDLIAASDLLLQTSRMEGMPNVLLEAQALGTPVVATAVGGTAECMADCLGGAAITEANADTLALACADLLCDRGRAAALGLQAAEQIGARFSIDQLVSNTLAVVDL